MTDENYHIEPPDSTEHIEEHSGYKVFMAALAEAFLRLDRRPGLRWTTAMLLYALGQSLEALRTNQGVSQRDYAQAKQLQQGLLARIEILRDLTRDDS